MIRVIVSSAVECVCMCVCSSLINNIKLQLSLHIEEFEDTKRAFRINPQIEGQTTQWPKEIKTNNDQQNTTQKTKDLAARPH
jgi:hypothetical protein